MTLKTCMRSCVCCIIILFAINPFVLNAQDEWGKTGLNVLWQGLRDGQPIEELPSGKAPFETPQRVAKKNIPTRLVPTQSNEWLISDGWELGTSTQVLESNESIFSLKFNTQDWYNATVPGTVLTTLVNQGVYPEPAFGLNNMSIPDTLCRMDWWYRTVFDSPSEAKGDRVKLLFNGINYRAEVFLNGKKLGNINGAFIRGEYDITSMIKDKDNVLAVLIHPPYNPGISHEQSMVAGQGLNGGQLSLDGPTFIASMGWDWIPGIRDRNIGLWQDVRLRVGGDVKIGDPHVISNLPLPDTTRATLIIMVPVKNLTNNAINGTLQAAFNGIRINMPYALQANEEKTLVFTPEEYKELLIQKPKLWWPNGYGSQNLYDLSLQANAGEVISDTKKLRFGIRELSYELMIRSEQKGNHRILYTPVDADNGKKPIFNYEKVAIVGEPRLQQTIPTLQEGVNEDALFESLSNDDPVGQFLVFRVNGKRIFIKGATWGMDEMMKRLTREKMELFFRLEKDANFNMIRNWTGENTEELFYELADEYGLLVWNDFWITTDDTVDPNDHQLFFQNARDAVRRFRTHPSIAIWCPRNEGYAPKGLESLLNTMIAEEDPTRHYHGNSRHLNAVNSGPYGYIKNASDYFTKYARGFNTELGAQAIPTAATIRKFIAPEDLWPINDVWAYHDLHHKSHFFGDFIEAVNSYGEATGMEDFAKKGQMVSYNTWRTIIEAVNSKMWDNTTGLILWMSHPSWPSMTWQTHTYDYETPGAYFGVKKAQEPIHIQMNLPDHKVIILNNTQVSQKGMTVTVKGYDIQGKQYYNRTAKYDAAAGQKTDCFIAEIEQDAPAFALIRLELRNRKGEIVSVNDYWKNWDDLKANQTLNGLEAVKPLVSIKSSGKGRSVIEVSNTSNTIAAAIKLNACDKTTKELILPAFFSEGYFNLLPGEKRRIELVLPENISAFDILTDGYNIDK
ncbi:MAG: glycoside hydrolase family 2 [Tannerella sp.]|nr:glycoside hydrolase family 2 [Tannerella sp.]